MKHFCCNASRWKVTALATLVLLQFVVTGCARSILISVNPIPLDVVEESLPIIHVMVEDKPAAFVIDTGAESTLIKPSSARRLGLVIRQTDQKTWDAHMAVRRAEGVANVVNITAGGVKLTNQQAWCQDLPLPPGVDGLLSRSAFSQLVFSIDYPKKQLTFDQPLRANDVQTVPVGVHAQSAVRVPVQFQNHKDWFMIDTGFAGSMSMNNETLQRVGAQKLDADHRSSGVNSSIVTSLYRIAGPFYIGNHEFKDVIVIGFPGAKNMIGSGLLKPYRLTIDQPNRLLRLTNSRP